MNITELSLTNFRNARTLKFSGELSFDSRINVFYGINGAGKSTILDSIAILLSWFAARMKSPNGSGRSIRLEDINNGASSVAVGLSLNCSDTSFNWSIVKNSPGRQNVDSKSSFSGVIVLDTDNIISYITMPNNGGWYDEKNSRCQEYHGETQRAAAQTGL